MPNIKSAKKRVKVIAVKTARNKACKSALKTTLNKAYMAVENNSADKTEAVRLAMKKKMCIRDSSRSGRSAIRRICWRRDGTWRWPAGRVHSLSRIHIS